MKTKYVNLSLVLCLVLGSLLSAHPANAQTAVNEEFPACTLDTNWFWSDPAVPSIFDWVTFGFDGCVTPDNWVCHWDFGDGNTSDNCFVEASQRYSQDGDYTVNVQATAPEGTLSITQLVPVRTHDVAITRFNVPQSGHAGQTRQLTVYVRNTRYLEKVQVELYKNDMVWVGTLIQDVPPRSANRTTAFNFTYTFTAEDARAGKITFRAMAFILENGGDDWQVDNDVVAPPTRVSH
jgi:hypothetical protein